METLNLFLVSDSMGKTVELLALAAAGRFGVEFAAVRRFYEPIDDREAENIVKEASCSRSVLVCALAEKKTRAFLSARCAAFGVPFVDLLGQLQDYFETGADCRPLREERTAAALEDEFFRKIEAIQFTLQCDDGRDPELLPKADLVILGVSRTGKTPLSMYMANRGFRTGNVTLVPEVTPPEVLRTIPPSKITGLHMSCERLSTIRRERLRLLGLNEGASAYADVDRVARELEAAGQYMRSLEATVLDVTQKSLEEIAQEILDRLRSR